MNDDNKSRGPHLTAQRFFLLLINPHRSPNNQQAKASTIDAAVEAAAAKKRTKDIKNHHPIQVTERASNINISLPS